MPELAPDQLEALRADIAANGVLVPITVDQHGRILDGHNRSVIAAEVGIECPRVVHEVVDDEAAMDVAVVLNCARRHLTRDQKRELVRAELVRRPDDSDRAVARRVGCSPSTVGVVRSEVSKLDTPAPDPAEARRRADLAGEAIKVFAKSIDDLIFELLTFGVSNLELYGALTACGRAIGDGHEAAGEIAAMVFDPRLEWLLSPAVDEWMPMADTPRLPEDERRRLLDLVAAGGAR